MAESTPIAIVDMGGQYVYNFERILREIGVENIVLPFDVSIEMLRKLAVKGIILSGGPYGVYEDKSPKLSSDLKRFINDENHPTLGVCYGHQLIARDLVRGSVVKGNWGEYGFSRVSILDREDPMFSGIPGSFTCWMSHGDIVQSAPHFKKTAETDTCEYAAIRHTTKQIYGLQFHPEVTHTDYGDDMLKNFTIGIAHAPIRQWDLEMFIDSTIQDISQQVGKGKLIAALSGGVDSTVAAVLAEKALGRDRLRCIHIDTGLMRKGESDQVVEVLQRLGIQVKRVDAADRFLSALANISESDEKRRAIGQTFIQIFEREALRFGADHLLQATIAPDVIESTRGQAERMEESKHGGFIKLHHNVGGLPEVMRLSLVEPFRNLFKYQVRLLAHRLNLPDEITQRQPQPGPSAAVRIAGPITASRATLWRDVNDYVENHISRLTLAQKPDQYFAILVPNQYDSTVDVSKISEIVNSTIGDQFDCSANVLRNRTIGVKGDERAYGFTAVLRLNHEGNDSLSGLDHLTLLNLQTKITGRIKDVTRVAVLISRQIDFKRPYAIVVRSVETRDFMTAKPSNLPWSALEEMQRFIQKTFPSIGSVMYDYSTKPSATIEYE